MTPPDLSKLIHKALDSQKDFQRATTMEVYRRLFELPEASGRMLVADEVGLGKTIVAKGVIARRLQALQEDHAKAVDGTVNGDQWTLNVTYICSNQVIAGENIGKLDVYPKKASHEHFASRISFLAFEPPATTGHLRLNSLTPGTSFVSSRDPYGQQDERKIIHALLMSDDALKPHQPGAALLLRGGVTREEQQWIAHLANWAPRPLRKDLYKRYLERVRSQTVEGSQRACLGDIQPETSISLYEAVRRHVARLTITNHTRYKEANRTLCGMLRATLIDACIEYIDADLYVLDEFQRFSDLIDQDSETEAAHIAQRIFSKQGARVLLLSATPFKALTTARDEDAGEEHCEEFRRVLGFLFHHDAATQVATYEAARSALYRQLRTLSTANLDLDPRHRDTAQELLREVMCRTERLDVMRDHAEAASVLKTHQAPLEMTPDDIENFLATDRIAMAVGKCLTNRERGLQAPLEFCKSAPYPLSFLDGYALKKKLKAVKGHSAIQTALKRSPRAWIDMDRVDDYSLEVGSDRVGDRNAKLSSVVDNLFEDHSERFLWVPPSLPYYPLAGTFQDGAGFSKVLVFSAWLMVPRMLSALLSYEAERRTIGHITAIPQGQLHGSKRARKRAKKKAVPRVRYFLESRAAAPKDGRGAGAPASGPTRRHKTPLRFRVDGKNTPGSMELFALLYPSPTLARALSLVGNLKHEESYEAVHQALQQTLSGLIQEHLAPYLNADGDADPCWYWAAPLLLDRALHHDEITQWLRSPYRYSALANRHLHPPGSGGKANDTRSRHLDYLRECFEAPETLGLGRPPDDLAETLATIALGSPAVLMLRSLLRLGHPVPDSASQAFGVAGAFIRLFNKPESVVVIKMNDAERQPESGKNSSPKFWRRVLRYCADGCLQAVLDEYLHLLVGEMKTLHDAVERLWETINIKTVEINVDGLESFQTDKPRKMRCHFALMMGSQRLETEEGQKRVASIRMNFNSPFKPFLLATTSIGQEGLDFHQYCRKIVHWNLPANPIDVEQREGRINRFKGLFIRQTIGKNYGPLLRPEDLQQGDIWKALFDTAKTMERGDRCELVPYWHVRCDDFPIERIVPIYRYSKDQQRLSRLIKTLTVYRLTFGQPNQTELVEHILTTVPSDRLQEVKDNLMICLSPIQGL